MGVPAVFVPLPIGNGEQALNAAGLVAAGGALIVDDKAFSADWINGNIIPLLQDTDRLARMAASSEQLGIRNADRRMADLILEVASSNKHSGNRHRTNQHGRKQ